ARGRIPTLKLNSLAWTRKRPDCDGAALGVCADQVADEKVAPVKFIQVFVYDQANKQIAARFFLVLRRQVVKSFSQYFVCRAVANLMDEVPFRLGNGPGLTNWGALLRNSAGQTNTAAHRNAHAT